MTSVFDSLRSGKPVKFKEDLAGRLNFSDKTLEMSDGRKIYVGDDEDFFPSSEESKKFSQEKESIERGIAKRPGGEFLHQLTTQGLIGAGADWINYISSNKEDYSRNKLAKQTVSQRISKDSPGTSIAATVTSMVPDLLLTRGMSGLVAGPTLAVAHAGPRIFEQPEQVAKEAALGAFFGKIIDVGANKLNKIAQRRAEFRSLPQKQAEVTMQNKLGQEAVEAANVEAKQRFNALQQEIKSQNAQKLENYQKELLSRKNKIIQDENEFSRLTKERQDSIIALKNKKAKEKADLRAEQARVDREYESQIESLKLDNKILNDGKKFEREIKITELKNKRNREKAQREDEIRKRDQDYEIELRNVQETNKRLTEEFKESQKKYQEELKKLPEIQERLQKEYSEQVLKNVEKVEKAFPRGAKIVVDEIDIPSFIDRFIAKTGRAGTSEGKKASKVISSLFPEGETITAKDLVNRYKAVEELIQRSNTAEKAIYNDFKTHLGDKIPFILENNIAFSRVVPSLQKQIEKDIESVFKGLKLKEGFSSPQQIQSIVKSNVKKFFSELTPKDFVNKIRSREFKEELASKFLTPYDMAPTAKSFGIYEKNISKGKGIVPAYYQDSYNEVLGKLKSKLDNSLAKSEIKMIASDVDAARKLGKGIEKTLGIASEIETPPQPSLPQMVQAPPRPQELPSIAPIELPAPIQPEPLNIPPRPQELPSIAPIELPPEVARPAIPEYPMRPAMTPIPEAPIPQVFTPQEMPTLAPAQGVLENVGDFLESNPLKGGRGILNNPYAKLAGLKYLLGPAAIPLEAGYLGLKGITSPTHAGEMARAGFKQIGIQAVAQIAQKYPSYHDGILDDPRERRSLTKEIENDPQIPLQEKALLQSKINRGKSIFERIQ